MKLGSILSYPRILVYLKQIASELRRSNEIAESMMTEGQYKQYKDRLMGKTSKLVDVYQPTVEEWNKRWRESHPTDEEEG
jgi:hypothetical protein